MPGSRETRAVKPGLVGPSERGTAECATTTKYSARCSLVSVKVNYGKFVACQEAKAPSPDILALSLLTRGFVISVYFLKFALAIVAAVGLDMSAANSVLKVPRA